MVNTARVRGMGEVCESIHVLAEVHNLSKTWDIFLFILRLGEDVHTNNFEWFQILFNLGIFFSNVFENCYLFQVLRF